MPKKVKLSKEDILKIRHMLKEGFYQKEIAEEFKIHQTTVSNIKMHKIWKD